MTAEADPGSEPKGYVAAMVGAVVGSLIGGLIGIRVGISLVGEPTRTSDNPLDDLFVNAFEVIGALLLVAAVTIVVLCAGVAAGVYVGLRARQQRLAGATALLCVALDTLAIPGAFVVAIAVDEIVPDLSVLAGLAVLVLIVPLAARWLATRVPPPARDNSL